MVSSVIVTVCCEKKGFQVDMELPASIPVYLLKEQLLEVLKIMDPGRFGKTAKINLKRNGSVISGIDSLADAGVWDGSILQMILEE